MKLKASFVLNWVELLLALILLLSRSYPSNPRSSLALFSARHVQYWRYDLLLQPVVYVPLVARLFALCERDASGLGEVENPLSTNPARLRREIETDQTSRYPTREAAFLLEAWRGDDGESGG